ncbi:MAG: phosphodiester glycosidase family protein [Deltaproteobacteria bacterium]|nr:phosphodiester glycosidase family protein [Deltaproteobacteria bacterium]MBP7289316.1 phosphodiester glycosidase family protein [Nannocystaceae bacterium]
MGTRAIIVVGSLWLAASNASAADTWTTPKPGIRYLERTVNTPNRIFAMEIDLCHDGVSIRATKSAERQRTVSSFAGLVGADAAVNGDFFSYEDYHTSGMAIGAGERWADTADTSGSGFVAFGRGRVEVWPPAPVLAAPEPWMRELVSGRRPLVEDGVPYEGDDLELCINRHPRTAAGVTADGRTLLLVVVDGRSGISVGMTCAELGELMVDLGAYQASMLDGGGSSTMWIEGMGVQNSPSDGSQRVVGNHLGVFATGSGEPGSCDRSWEESNLHAEFSDASTTSDVDGDGRDDVCARAAAGVRCVLSAADAAAPDDGLGTELIGPALTDDDGWDDPTRYGSLRMGDIDGNGRADLCARDATGVRCFLSQGVGLDTEIAGPALGDEQGWSKPEYGSTLRLADIDGDGRDDLCARAKAGLMCWRSRGDGFADEAIVLPELGDDAGFDAESLYGTIRTADIDADARVDVCARTTAGMRCWPSTGDGFGAAIDGPAWSDDAGWSRVEYWSTIRLVDLDGDRRADLCARAADGIHCNLSSGTDFATEILGPVWADDSGWWDYSNYSTIRFADIDGDGDLDLCARANAGLRCAAFEGDGFAEAFAGPALSDDTGWSSIRFFSTLRFADIDGDGMADLCARAAAGLRCWTSRGDGFADTAIVGPAWSDDSGWKAQTYYESVRAVDTRARCIVEEVCGNDRDDDCDGATDEDCSAEDTGGAATGDGTGDDGGEASSGGGGTTGGSSDDGLPDGFGESEGGGGCACDSGRAERSSFGLIGLVGLVVLALHRRAKLVVARRARARASWMGAASPATRA